jgi:hypothetical protein
MRHTSLILEYCLFCNVTSISGFYIYSIGVPIDSWRSLKKNKGMSSATVRCPFVC